MPACIPAALTSPEANPRIETEVSLFDRQSLFLAWVPVVDAAWERVVIRGDVEAVRQLLQSGANVDARDQYGQTALMLAAHHGHRELVETLIGCGADLNVTAKYNLTALMLAIVAGHAAIARLLARAGADLSIKGSGAPGFMGKTARDLAVDREMEHLYVELEPR